MRIQNNIAAMNSHRQLGATTTRGAQSMEKLSSGFRINRAGDDAAGLAISEKMRGQIRGLTQASRNAQDGISMIQTAEGALNETHNILQRMRELAVQSASDTNVEVDRGAIQNEINQLKSEIDRIGDTTEFNTQSLLKGDGKVSLTGTGIASAAGTIGDGTSGTKGLTTHTQAAQTITASALTAGQLKDTSLTVNIQGESITLTFKEDNSIDGTDAAKIDSDSVTKNAATVNVKGAVGANNLADAIRTALNSVIKSNDTLKGNFEVTGTSPAITMSAISKELGGEYYGEKGFIAGTANVDAITALAAANLGTTAHTQATHKMDFATITTSALATDLIGQGLTIDGKQYEFYNADAGAYTGDAIGINISGAFKTGATIDDEIASAVGAQVKSDNFTAAVAGSVVTFTAVAKGADGNGTAKFADGGVQEEFKATFQIGANQAQTMDVKIGDMRSKALGVQDVDLSNSTSAQAAITTINDAIEKVSAQRSELGAFQNRLEYTIKNLDTSAENLQASESRIRDVDMAKEMMNFTKNNILQQAAQAMLAQANQAPQGVLQLLR